MKRARCVLNLQFFISVALLFLLAACGQPNGSSQVSAADGQGGLVLPFAVTTLPNINDVHATLDCPNGASVPMDINTTDNTVYGKCEGVQAGTGQTFTIVFTYGNSRTELAHASKTIDVTEGNNPSLTFTTADYIEPDDDKDGYSNLEEIANGTNPALPNYSVDVAADSLPFTIASLQNPAALTATLDCPDGSSVNMTTDATANTAAGTCAGLMANLSGGSSQVFTITFTDSSTNSVLVNGSKNINLVAGTNPALSFSSTDLTGALSNLNYASNPASYAVNQAITTNTPLSDGGTVESYTITPALPAGFNFDASTGVITGTPTVITSGDYTVQAINAIGSTSVVLHIDVNDIPPKSLVYDTNNTAIYTVGDTVSNIPTHAGGAVTTYSLLPTTPLPAGLSLNTSTGEISGKPTVVTAQTVVTITATNSGGSTQADVSITVNAALATNFTVGGTVVGLTGTGLTLQDNGGDNLSISANGSFTFPTQVAIGASYVVTVLSQPTNPPQICTVSNGSGTATTSNITNVTVTCTIYWILEGGTGYLNLTSVYPTSIGGSGGMPGGRWGASTWIDSKGQKWLFGGDSNFGYVNDLWLYDPLSQTWIWEGGGTDGLVNTFNVAGVYPTAAGGTGTPGSRSGAVTWTDEFGTLYLFGGYGYDSAGTLGSLNDLWQVDPTTGVWTWFAGSTTVGAAGTYSTTAPGTPGARSGATYWNVGSRLWMFGGYGYDSAGTLGNLNDLWMYDDRTGTWSWKGGADTVSDAGTYAGVGNSGTPGARTDATGWTDSSGRLWLFGGYGNGSAGTAHLNELWMYDPTTGTWTWEGAGSTTSYTYPTNVGDSGTPMPRENATSWTDSSGRLWLFGGYGTDPNPSGSYGPLNDVWMYDLGTGTWTWEGGAITFDAVGTYPVSVGGSGTPGARSVATHWADSVGKLWLLGGSGHGDGAVTGGLNDLWSFQP